MNFEVFDSQNGAKNPKTKFTQAKQKFYESIYTNISHCKSNSTL